MDKTTAVVVAVVTTLLACAWLFRREDEPGETGRYVVGRTNLSMLDTKEGRLIIVKDISEDSVSVLEIDAKGMSYLWRHDIININLGKRK